MSQAGCTGKRMFLTFSQAKGAAKNATRHNGEPMRPYMCTSCHKFHIGNSRTLVAKRPRSDYSDTGTL